MMTYGVSPLGLPLFTKDYGLSLFRCIHCPCVTLCWPLAYYSSAFSHNTDVAEGVINACLLLVPVKYVRDVIYFCVFCVHVNPLQTLEAAVSSDLHRFRPFARGGDAEQGRL